MSLILVTRIPREGAPYKMVLNTNNLIEVTPTTNGSWMKYWDGKEVRSAMITETPEDLAD